MKSFSSIGVALVIVMPIAATTLLLAMSALGQNPIVLTPSAAHIPFQAGTEPTTVIDKEAANQAIIFWNATKLGESHLVYEILNRSHSTSIETLYELRGATLEVKSESLTEADKLNGIGWNGTVCLRAKAVRSCNIDKSSNKSADRVWGAWYSTDKLSAADLPYVRVSIARISMINNKWLIMDCIASRGWGGEYNKYSYKKVETADIPK